MSLLCIFFLSNYLDFIHWTCKEGRKLRKEGGSKTKISETMLRGVHATLNLRIMKICIQMAEQTRDVLTYTEPSCWKHEVCLFLSILFLIYIFKYSKYYFIQILKEFVFNKNDGLY